MRIATRLIACDHPGRRICRLCFGTPIARRQIAFPGHTDTIHDFSPGQLFGVVWWKRHPDDRQHRAVAVLQALPRTQVGFSLPNVSSGVLVHAMLDQHGPAGQEGSVDRFLQLVESLRRAGKDPADVPAIVYRMFAHQILLDQDYALASVLQCLRYPHVSNN